MTTPPVFPIGPEPVSPATDEAARFAAIGVLERAPAALRVAVEGLGAAGLDTVYKNWTARQIVHHVADSHVNAYVRFKLALTEESPVIKPYAEGAWAGRVECCHGDVELPLRLLEGLHGVWVGALRGMSEAEFGRAFFHPEAGVGGAEVTLGAALASYAWHCGHHAGQIEWMAGRG